MSLGTSGPLIGIPTIVYHFPDGDSQHTLHLSVLLAHVLALCLYCPFAGIPTLDDDCPSWLSHFIYCTPLCTQPTYWHHWPQCLHFPSCHLWIVAPSKLQHLSPHTCATTIILQILPHKTYYSHILPFTIIQLHRPDCHQHHQHLYHPVYTDCRLMQPSQNFSPT